MNLDQEMLKRLELLEEKFSAMGQDMKSYLDGLLYADYLTYWDYIHLDTLLSLQNPRTPIPDEEIFILYHQITELYFKLIIKAIKQAIKVKEPEEFKTQLRRVNRYFHHLIDSFDVMVEGMDKDEFLQFRMSLLPASGFQSAQYRIIEILSTDFFRLVHKNQKEEGDDQLDIESLYNKIYWKFGATELATGKKTLTLKQFEAKYKEEFIDLGLSFKSTNLWQTFRTFKEEGQDDDEMKALLRLHDHQANILWPLEHFRSAMRYLNTHPKHIEATGGTNWQEYLPPKFQQVIFYPELWSEEELSKWGRRTRLKTTNNLM